METSQGVKTVLIQQAEVGVRKLLEHLQTVEEGDLKGLEQQMLETIFAIGRQWMETILSEGALEERASSQRIGRCGHLQQLVGYRPKQVLTLLGKVTFRRAYYQCVVAGDRAEGREMQGGEAEASTQEVCTHGEAPRDVLWGLQEQRTSAGVQQAVSYLCASLTLEEAAETFSRLLPLQMSARQALNLMQPLGEALQQQEDEQVRVLWEQAMQARTPGYAGPTSQQDSIDRLYIELDGVLARLRRGSVAMEEQERKRKGDVYREVKVGAVFEATRGPERSGLARGVFVDQAGQKQYVARQSRAEDFGKLLYTLAISYGLERARQLVVVGDGAVWIWRLVAEHFPQAVQIVDIWHAREHIWKVARAVFVPGSPEASAWANHACGEARWRARSRTWSRRSSSYRRSHPSRKPRAVCQRSNGTILSAMPLACAIQRFARKRMHVGSGIAEAACKTVVSTRAKRAGMRWTPAGLDAVLAVRTKVLNDTYDAFCEQHSLLVA